MTDLTTLSRLLSSQEERDAAPCVPAVDGNWHMSRDGYLARYHDNFTLSTWKQTGQFWAGSTCHKGDCIWSGDLPALLAELLAGHEQLGEQWNGLQDMLQARDERIAELEAKLAEARRQVIDMIIEM